MGGEGEREPWGTPTMALHIRIQQRDLGSFMTVVSDPHPGRREPLPAVEVLFFLDEKLVSALSHLGLCAVMVN